MTQSTKHEGAGKDGELDSMTLGERLIAFRERKEKSKIRDDIKAINNVVTAVIYYGSMANDEIYEKIAAECYFESVDSYDSPLYDLKSVAFDLESPLQEVDLVTYLQNIKASLNNVTADKVDDIISKLVENNITIVITGNKIARVEPLKTEIRTLKP